MDSGQKSSCMIFSRLEEYVRNADIYVYLCRVHVSPILGVSYALVCHALLPLLPGCVLTSQRSLVVYLFFIGVLFFLLFA